MIKKVDSLEIEVPTERETQTKTIHQDVDKSYISKCFARLKRYRKEPQHIAGPNMLDKMFGSLVPEGPSICTYKEKYFVVHTFRRVYVYEWIVDEVEIRY
jgi:hypothetical protein